MAIGTRALRQEVCQVPSPGGFDYEHEGFVFNDGETGVTSARRSATTS